MLGEPVRAELLEGCRRSGAFHLQNAGIGLIFEPVEKTELDVNITLCRVRIGYMRIVKRRRLELSKVP